MKLALIVLFTICAAVNAEQATVFSEMLERSRAPNNSGGSFFNVRKLMAFKGGKKSCAKPSEDEMQNATPQQRIDKMWEVVVCEADSK
jgi:hypothetical protein